MEPSPVCGCLSPFLLLNSMILPQLLQLPVVASRTALSPAMYSSLWAAQVLGQAQSPHVTYSLSLSPDTVVHTCYIQAFIAHCLSLAVAGLRAPSLCCQTDTCSSSATPMKGHLGLFEATLGATILPAHTRAVAHCHTEGKVCSHAYYPWHS